MTFLLTQPLITSLMIPILAVVAAGGIKLLVSSGQNVRISLHLFVFGTELSLSAVVLCISTLIGLLGKALLLPTGPVPRPIFDFAMALAVLTFVVMFILIWAMAGQRLYQQNFPENEKLPFQNCFGYNLPGIIAMFFVAFLLAEHQNLL